MESKGGAVRRRFKLKKPSTASVLENVQEVGTEVQISVVRAPVLLDKPLVCCRDDDRIQEERKSIGSGLGSLRPYPGQGEFLNTDPVNFEHHFRLLTIVLEVPFFL